MGSRVSRAPGPCSGTPLRSASAFAPLRLRLRSTPARPFLLRARGTPHASPSSLVGSRVGLARAGMRRASLARRRATRPIPAASLRSGRSASPPGHSRRAGPRPPGRPSCLAPLRGLGIGAARSSSLRSSARSARRVSCPPLRGGRGLRPPHPQSRRRVPAGFVRRRSRASAICASPVRRRAGAPPPAPPPGAALAAAPGPPRHAPLPCSLRSPQACPEDRMVRLRPVLGADLAPSNRVDRPVSGWKSVGTFADV